MTVAVRAVHAGHGQLHRVFFARVEVKRSALVGLGVRLLVGPHAAALDGANLLLALGGAVLFGVLADALEASHRLAVIVKHHRHINGGFLGRIEGGNIKGHGGGCFL